MQMDKTALKSQLETGIETLDIFLDEPKINQLVEYVFLLNKWNKVYFYLFFFII